MYQSLKRCGRKEGEIRLYKASRGVFFRRASFCCIFQQVCTCIMNRLSCSLYDEIVQLSCALYGEIVQHNFVHTKLCLIIPPGDHENQNSIVQIFFFHNVIEDVKFGTYRISIKRAFASAQSYRSLNSSCPRSLLSSDQILYSCCHVQIHRGS